jgi:hypothetical protein
MSIVRASTDKRHFLNGYLQLACKCHNHVQAPSFIYSHDLCRRCSSKQPWPMLPRPAGGRKGAATEASAARRKATTSGSDNNPPPSRWPRPGLALGSVGSYPRVTSSLADNGQRAARPSSKTAGPASQENHLRCFPSRVSPSSRVHRRALRPSPSCAFAVDPTDESAAAWQNPLLFLPSPLPLLGCLEPGSRPAEEDMSISQLPVVLSFCLRRSDPPSRA